MGQVARKIELPLNLDMKVSAWTITTPGNFVAHVSQKLSLDTLSSCWIQDYKPHDMSFLVLFHVALLKCVITKIWNTERWTLSLQLIQQVIFEKKEIENLTVIILKNCHHSLIIYPQLTKKQWRWTSLLFADNGVVISILGWHGCHEGGAESLNPHGFGFPRD